MSHQCQHQDSGACAKCRGIKPTGFADFQWSRKIVNHTSMNSRGVSAATEFRRLGSNKPTKWRTVIRFPLVTSAKA